MLAHHLPLTDRGGIQFEAEGSFGSRQSEHQRHRLADFPTGDVQQNELRFGCIGGDQAEAAPARNREPPERANAGTDLKRAANTSDHNAANTPIPRKTVMAACKDVE